MNCTYRSIWNDTTGTFVAVSENAKSAGKKTSSCTSAKDAGARFTLQALAVSVMLSFGANVHALPAGGVVTAGGASISSGAGNTTITQSTQNAAINWQSFNIATGEAVRFVQPNSSSVTLNRVLGSDPSSIFGSLSANGKVFLVNPNGILFGQGASVNVGGLVASTLNITDSDFMAGSYKFAGAGAGKVLNQGAIHADGGYVALLGANVSNDGVISARLGTVALAAGKAITLDVAGDGLLNVTVNQGAVNALVQNGGLIQADGGQVLLTAQAAGSLLQSAVNNTGVIQAQTIENHNGTIKLLGDMQSGTVTVAGTLDVSGAGAGQTGGNVTVTGHHVGLFGGHINASGDAGGGTVLVGGDYQGKNPSVQNASATYVSADSSVKADAITSGNGGKIIVWSDDSTRAYGSFTARGGTQSGNGGLIETSGHYLDVAGAGIDAGAPHGRAGTWLLDPFDVTITAGLSAGGAFGVGDPDVWTPNATGSNVQNSQINALLVNTNVTITTTGVDAGTGTISVNAPITRSSGGPAATTLTLTPDAGAGGAVNVAAAISGSSGNPLNVNLAATGGIVSVSAPITTWGGTFQSTGTTFTNSAAGPIDTSSSATTGGTLTINQAGFVTISGNLTSSGGDISITGSDLTLSGPPVSSGSGNVTLKPKTATSIGVGAGTGVFSVSDAELAFINPAGSTGTITIGARTLASTMIVEGIGVAATNLTKNLRLATAGTINDNAAATAVTLTTGTLTLDAASTIGNTTTFNVDVAKLAVKTEASFNITSASTLTDLGVTTNGAAIAQNLVSPNLTYTVAEAGSNTTVDAVTKTVSALNLSYQNTLGNITVATSGITTNGGAVTLSAGDSVTLNAGINTGTAPVTINFGQVTGGTFTAASSITTAGLVGINGGGNADTFDFSGAPAITATLAGGGGTDTLKQATKTWTLNDATQNWGTSGGLTWSAIGNLTDTGAGIFNMGTGGSVSGSVTATGGTLNYSSYATPVAINQQNTTATGMTAFSGIGVVVGNGATTTITGLNAGETFNVTSPDAGTAGALVFTGVGSLTGGTGDDSFTLSAGGTLSGAIVGGLGVNTLAGSTTYVVTGANSGTATGVSGGFTQIANLTGTTGADTFTFAGGTLSGLMTGGGGADSLSGTTAGAANFTGGGVSSLNIGALTAASVGVSGTTAINVNGAVNTGAGAVGLTSTGTISEGVGGSITAGTLTTSAAGGTTLGGANAVTNFGATDTGAVSLANTAATLGLNAITSAGLTVNNVGSLAINAATAIAEGSSNVTLVANGGNFVNNSGVVAPITASQWWVYSTSPALDTPNGMTAANWHYAQSYTGTTPAYASIGNWNLYSVTPVLSVTPSTQTVIYGTVPSFTPNYTGFLHGDTSGTAGISGTATFSVAGTTSTSGNYTVGSHDVSYSNGLLSSRGYTFADNVASLNELTVNARNLTVSATGVNRVYNGLLDATAILADNRVAGDVLTTGYTSAAYLDKNVANGKTVNVSGISLSNTDAGNYSFNTTAATTANITQANLTLSTSNVTKIYNGDLTAAGTAVVASGGGTLFSGDTLSGGSFAFTDKNVGLGNKTVTVSTVTVGDGVYNGNYNVGYADNTTSTINPRAVNLSGSRAYDGTPKVAAAVLTIGTPLVGSETLTLVGSGTVADKNVGTGKTVTVTGLTLGDGSNGGLASNYTFTGGTQTADITQANLTLSGTRVYDGLTAYAGSNLTATGVAGETFAIGGLGGTSNLVSKNVQTHSTLATVTGLTLGDGSGGGVSTNYNVLSTAGSSVDVTKAPLTITADDKSKNYGATDPTLTASYSAFQYGDNASVVTGLNLSTATGPAATAGTHSIDVSGSSAHNYAITEIPGTLTVDKANLTVTASDASKIYGQTPTLTAFTTAGLVYGETVGSVTETSPGTVAAATVANSPYPITPSIATGGTFTPSNYTIGYVNGALTVLPLVPPPVVVPPVEPPPEIVPPVEPPPEVVLPVEPPPDVVLPVEPPPDVVLPVEPVIVPGETSGTAPVIVSEEMLGGEEGVTPAASLVVVPAWMPTVVLAKTPAELLSILPASVPVETPTVVPEQMPIVVPALTPPKIYVAPHRPNKQDRN